MRKVSAAALKVLLMSAMLTLPAHAQATRTWVSGVGDDANPGSRTAPCKTFAGAFAKTATGGEVDVLDPGGFGTLTITRSITLDGGGGQVGSIFATGLDGIVINANGSDVTIRNLRFDGLSGGVGIAGLNGIKIVDAANVLVDSCFINNFGQYGLKIDTTSGASTSTNIAIRNTVISQCTQGGVVVTNAKGPMEVDNCSLLQCGSGLELHGGVANVTNSQINQTTKLATGLPAPNNLTTGVALNALGNGVISATGCIFANNTTPTATTTGASLVLTQNTFYPAALATIGVTTSSGSTSQAISSSQPAVFVITLTPPPGGFPAPITFSAAGLPSNMTATFSPATLPANANPATTTLTVTLNGKSAAAPKQGPATLALLAACALPLGLRRRNLRGLATLSCAVTIALAVSLAGCGGGSSGSSPVVSSSSGNSSSGPSSTDFVVNVGSGTQSAQQLFTVTQ